MLLHSYLKSQQYLRKYYSKHDPITTFNVYGLSTCTINKAAIQIFIFVQAAEHNEDFSSLPDLDCNSFTSLEEALKNAGLEEHLRVLQKEQVDLEALVGLQFNSDTKTHVMG